jgi:RND family efflux transporter MFP subunit
MMNEHRDRKKLWLCHLVTLSPCHLVIFCLLASGCRKAPPPEEETHYAPVKAVPVRTEKMGEWTELLGATQPLPDRVARISASVEGHVLSVLADGKGSSVSEGQWVKKGQVIARLDDRVAKANQAKLATLFADLEEQKKHAEFAVQLAKIEVERLTELRRGATNGNIPLASKIDLDKSKIVLEEAHSKVEAVAAREKALHQEMKALEAQLDFYTLRAPIDGTLGLLHIVSGQTLSPGASVAEVIDLGEIDALCFAPPEVARKLKLGQRGRISGQKEASGKVVFIGVNAQPETGNFPVKVRFANKESALRSNTVVRVEVETEEEKERLVIPESALMEDEEPPAIVAIEGLKKEKEEQVGKAVRMRVKVGVRGTIEKIEKKKEGGKEVEEKTEVRVVEVKGLEKTEKKEENGKEVEKVVSVPVKSALVITEGAHGLKDGDDVKLEEEHGKD